MNGARAKKKVYACFLVTFLIWGWCVSTKFVLADETLVTADQRLDAIRQSLLDEALTGEVEVVSSAYVDSLGQLHESAYITAN